MPEFVRIRGVEEIVRRLRAMPAEVQKRVLRPALGAGAQVIKRAAVARAPISQAPIKRGGGRVTMPGVLRAAAIVKFIRNQSNATQAAYVVTFRKGKRAQAVGKSRANRDAFYASWVEFGHRIVPRTNRIGRDRRGRFINASTKRARKLSATGRVEGRRMLTRAFNETAGTALQVIEDRFRQNFDRAVR